jgi:hypothetical protein
MSDRIIVFELRRDNAWHAACSMVSARPLYADLPSSDFSRKVLEAAAENLAVLPVDGWTDLGEPARAAKALDSPGGLKRGPRREHRDTRWRHRRQ